MTEQEYDVVVVGSGAAGMTAALTAAHQGLSVVVVEKENRFGGSTARSGGGLWVPGMEAATYLAEVVGDDVPRDKQQAFLEHAQAMLSFVTANTPLRFAWVPGYADYYPEKPGGSAEGRTLEPVPFDGRILGAELAKLNPPYISTKGVTVTAADYKWLSLGARHWRAYVRAVRVGARTILSRLLGRRLLSMGQALAAGLRHGLLASKVPVLLDTALVSLIVENNRVVGIHTTLGPIRARRGVLLAAGGFEHNDEMRKKYQRSPIGTEWTVGAASNTGDAILAGQELGAATDFMDDAWWGPSFPLTGGPYFALAERSLPGCLFVNSSGRRFVNEAAPYVDAVHAMYDSDSVPAWMIFDQRYRNSYVFAGLGPRQPLPGRWYKARVVFRASTLAELASKIDVPADALASTVERLNGFARSGVDEDFHKGESAYDRYYGDPRTSPNPNLAPLEKAPFYAIKVVPGDLGTKGGLRTDAWARVLREDGTLIPGLYAAGNTSAAVMGHSYAGAGATIGPAMTFGYLAVLSMVEE